MQVNFNPSINQIKPNFKAKFINDKETIFALETMAQEDPISTLALYLNMLDNENGPNLAMEVVDDRCMGPYDRRCKDPVWIYKLYNPKVQKDMRYIKAIAHRKNPEDILIDYNNTIKGPLADYYYQKAKEMLKLSTSKSKEYNSMSNAINILASQKERLKRMLSDVETKLATTKASLNEQVDKQVVKKIL